jgi:hypothetical protein
MRDPARIDRIIDEIRELWKASPDLRLGQLLSNSVWTDPISGRRYDRSRIFGTEDHTTEERLLAALRGDASRTSPRLRSGRTTASR